MKLHKIKALTFDCYGTLIDWETGILQAFKPICQKNNLNITDDQILEAFAEAETALQQQYPTLLYPDILAKVVVELGKQWQIDIDQTDQVQFASSVGDWPAFADSKAALQYLAQHFKLIILSNIDKASFALSEKQLGVKFDAILTAQDIGSYKPSLNNFKVLIEHCQAIGIDKSEFLHVAQSLYHDHVPAKASELQSCWVNRRINQSGHGATKRPEIEVKPDLIVTNMAELAALHQAQSQE